MLFPAQWPVRKGTMTDAVIAFVSWSTTYLFVRRLLNPETVNYFLILRTVPFPLNLTLGMSCQMRVAIDRFSADAFYGGLAAAAASVFKSVLYAFLSSH